MVNKYSWQTPNHEELQRSQSLEEQLIALIQNEQSISFATFMEYALYTPQLGYYASSRHPFGHSGDFITAPELSDRFSQCMATFCQNVFYAIGVGDIIEVGAGSGRMAARLLLSLEEQNMLPNTYTIVEKSHTLQQYQQETLAQVCPHLLARIRWCQDYSQKPIKGIIIGNEFLDALPFYRFHWDGHQFFEYRVGRNQHGFVWLKEKIADTRLKNYLDELFMHPVTAQWPKRYDSEANIDISFWLSQFSKLLEQGIILLIDYGFPRHEYYHPDRHMGTMMCHYQHQAHDNVFLYPGLQDITAHIDFTYLADKALQTGLEILGFSSQSAFLMDCGLLNKLDGLTPSELAHLHLLTSPAEMGELFKVIALGQRFEQPLTAFQHYDQRHRLAL